MPLPFPIPSVDLHIIFPPPGGSLTDPYQESSRRTGIHCRSLRSIFRMIERINSLPPFADRVRTLEVNLVEDTPITRDLGLRISTVLPRLQKLQNLALEGCLEYNFSFLNTAVFFPHLTTLTCDFSPSPELERFLLANHTIKNLYFLGPDLHDYVGWDRILPWPALPYLEYVQCDIWIVRYFLSYRPLTEVMPQHYGGVRNDECLDKQIMSLRNSTANGGVERGGGVKSFWLGCYFPLEKLFNAAPNLRHLYLVEEDGNGTSACFWNTPGWENGLRLFQSLRKLSLRSLVNLSYEEQRSLVVRWSANASLQRITFNCDKCPDSELGSEGSGGAVDSDGSDSDDDHGRERSKWAWNQETRTWDVTS